MRPRVVWEMIRETFADWWDDSASRLAASLAYYTFFSLAPLLIIVIAVAGLVFGEEAARGEIVGQLSGLVGPDSAKAIESMVAAASKPWSGVMATIVGVVTLLIGATGVFAELQDSLNTIWEVKKKEERSGLRGFVRQRMLSFAMVLGIGFLLLVSLALSAGLSAAGALVSEWLPAPEWALQVINAVISLGVITFLFAMIYKVLPDTRVAWRDVWIGALVTALLFTVGKLLIGLYLGKSSVTSTYGAAGSLIVVLVWVYYSAQILFLGAEFTQVYARRHGSRIGDEEPAPAPGGGEPGPLDTGRLIAAR